MAVSKKVDGVCSTLRLKLVVAHLAMALSVVFLSACNVLGPASATDPTVTPTLTPEPIVPTRTASPPALATVVPAAAATATEVPTGTPTPEPSSTPATAQQPGAENQEASAPSILTRFGVTGGFTSAVAAQEAGLPFGALLNWNVGVEVPEADFEFWQMVRIEEAGIRRTTWDEIASAIAANPGSYWIVGNEPDVRWQDNVTPQRYAEIYHDVYTFIKERDPEASLVIGGVTQPTPLRRAYLDIVLNTYREMYGQEMPIDVWNVHAFTLREERDSWGVDIPPGMEDDLAIKYEIEDHDDLDILRQNLVEFRAWMAERGYGDKPLVITEYGILMPEDYGFPVERVGAFLTSSFDMFRTLSGENGYDADDNRLVQRWFWYSVYDNELYPTGNLYAPGTGELTQLGEIWSAYVTGLAAD